MLLFSAALLTSFVVLFKSPDFFIVGSDANAPNLNIHALFIGLSIDAMGASAAEIFVAAASTIQGRLELAAGNALGSNIANIGMLLAISTLLIPLRFTRTLSERFPDSHLRQNLCRCRPDRSETVLV